MNRSVGLVTEYNPFHNGHLYHLQESKRTTNAKIAVVVMSGHFLQRGEPALVDKWSRASMALAGGADLIFEIPFPFACASAPDFAGGALRLLSALNVDHQVFGAECSDLVALQAAARILEENYAHLQSRITELQRQGISYPRAREMVMTEEYPDTDWARIIREPNNILALEYLKAIDRFAIKIQPGLVLRKGGGFHSTECQTDTFASATAIRKYLRAEEPVSEWIPGFCDRLLTQLHSEGIWFDEDRYFRTIQTLFAREGNQFLTNFGLPAQASKHLYNLSKSATNIDELIYPGGGSQWTGTRIQRVLTHALINMTNVEKTSFINSGPGYLRLLGASDVGRAYLAEKRKDIGLPIISNMSRATSILKRWYGATSPDFLNAYQMLEFDLRATSIYRQLLISTQPENTENSINDYHRRPATRESA